MECFVIDFENLESVVVVADNLIDSHLFAGWPFEFESFVDSDPDRKTKIPLIFIFKGE